jgi:hypothetical protein
MLYSVKRKDIEKLIEMATRREGIPSKNIMTSGAGYTEWVRKDDPQLSEDKLIGGFLRTFSYEQIQTLQTIMYLGRDNDIEISDRTAEAIFDEKLRRLIWTNDIEIEIGTIVSKRPLATYLKEGMRLLGL